MARHIDFVSVCCFGIILYKHERELDMKNTVIIREINIGELFYSVEAINHRGPVYVQRICGCGLVLAVTQIAGQRF